MTDHDDDRDRRDDEWELHGDDITFDDMLDMFRRHADRPREKGVERKDPTLADSVLWHGMAGQMVPATNATIATDDVDVTVETFEATLTRPMLGRLQEEDDGD